MTQEDAQYPQSFGYCSRVTFHVFYLPFYFLLFLLYLYIVHFLLFRPLISILTGWETNTVPVLPEAGEKGHSD